MLCLTGRARPLQLQERAHSHIMKVPGGSHLTLKADTTRSWSLIGRHRSSP
jgi:hypothetical protein